MNIDIKDAITLAAGLIFLYLLLANPSGTQTVVQGIGGVTTNTIATLQGRGTNTGTNSLANGG